MTAGVTMTADEDVLRQCLGSAVPRIAGRQPAITGIDRRRFDLTTSYAAEVLTVRLDTGAGFTVFLKDFGSSVRPKDGPRQRREREVRDTAVGSVIRDVHGLPRILKLLPRGRGFPFSSKPHSRECGSAMWMGRRDNCESIKR